jgi:hypothetical protein
LLLHKNTYEGKEIEFLITPPFFFLSQPFMFCKFRHHLDVAQITVSIRRRSGHEAYEALKDLIETLKGITFVVKSHKEYGCHFYILTPVSHEPMGRAS